MMQCGGRVVADDADGTQICADHALFFDRKERGEVKENEESGRR